MSKIFKNRPPSKKLYLNNQSKSKKFLKKRSNSDNKYSPKPNLFTQMKPYLDNMNNIITRQNALKGSLTSNNYSKILTPELILPNKSPEFDNKKTLILDLDETLVHSSFVPFEKNDIVLNVNFDGFMYKIYVLVRPGAEFFIRNISKYYELIIFTASLSNYASPLLDILDKGENIKYRLFRENCTFMNGIYIKDLKMLNRNLKDLVIVDNSPLAYAFDIDNGLPIKTWYEDKNDIELYKINDILEFLSTVDDVRNYIKKFVKKNEIIYEEAMNLIKTLNNNNIKNNLFSPNYFGKQFNNIINNNNPNSKNNNESNLEKVNKIKDDISLNLNSVVNFCESKLKNENSKNNSEIEKIINEESNENSKKTLKAAAVLYNAQIKKNNFISPQDINKIKKRNKILENKKFNQKQLYKNNNFFRLNKKKEFNSKEDNNNNILNLNNSLKFKPIIPITFSNSSTPNIKSFVFNTTKNSFSKNNNLLHKKEEKFNIKLKNNYINIIQEKKEMKNFTNILRKINKNNIKNNVLKNNILKNEKLVIDKSFKPKLRISSSTISHRNYSPLNINKRNYKILMSFPVQRSKSTVHFFYDKIYHTPNNHMIGKNEKRKFHNLFGEIDRENSSKYNILGYNFIKPKQRRIQTAKIYKLK